MAIINTLLQLIETRKKIMIQTGTLKKCLADLKSDDEVTREKSRKIINKTLNDYHLAMQSTAELERRFKREAGEMGIANTRNVEAVLQSLRNEDYNKINEKLAIITDAGAQDVNHPAHEWFAILDQEARAIEQGSSFLTLRSLAVMMHEAENNGDPKEHAEKLSTMFADTQTALQYVALRNGVMHDACLFEIPEVEQLAIWVSYANKHFRDARFWELFPHAAELEPELMKKRSPQEWIDTLKSMQDPSLEGLIAEIAKIKPPGKPLEFTSSLPLCILRACGENYLRGAGKGYTEFLARGMPKKQYEKFMLLERVDDDTEIPPINLKITLNDGREFTFSRLSVENYDDAVLAAGLGKDTNCCQYLGGAGAECVKHGLTSPHAGFYVIRSGNEVVAQSFTMRAKSGAIIFDSIEINPAFKGVKSEIIAAFGKAATHLIENQHTHKVVCGARSGISHKVGVNSVMEEQETPKKYDGYRDSYHQRCIDTVSAPYYRYQMDFELMLKFMESEDKQSFLKVCDFIKKQLSDPTPPHELPDFVKFLNYLEILNLEIDAQKNHISSFVDKLPADQSLNDFLNDKSDKVSDTLPEECVEIYKTMKQNLHEYFQEFVGKILVYQSLFAFLNGELDQLRQNDKEKYEAVEKIMHIAHEYFQALSERDCSKIQTLLQQCPLVNIVNNEGSLLTMALSSHADELAAQLLAGGASLHIPDYRHVFPLGIAAGNGNLNLVKTLIQAGADVNAQNDNGGNALLFALNANNVEITFELLKYNVNPNSEMRVSDYVEITALGLAIKSGKTRFVEALLQKGADPNEGTHDTYPLILAVRFEQSYNTRILLKAGANVNAQSMNDDGNIETPLMIAVQAKNPALVKILLARKPDLSVRCGEETALDMAKRLQHPEIIALLTAAHEELARLSQKGFFSDTSKTSDNTERAIVVYRGPH